MRELSEAEVRVDQQIGTAVLGSMRTATLFAGVNDAVDPATLPASTADFASESGRIGRLILTGHAELSGAPFVDAHVAAWSIGMAKLHAEPANDGVDHGLTAHRFGALLTRVGDNPTPWTLRSLEEADGEQRLGNFLLQQVQNTP